MNSLPENITKELNGILFDTLKKERIESDYHQLKNLLSEGGNASANAAKSIYEFTKVNKVNGHVKGEDNFNQ